MTHRLSHERWAGVGESSADTGRLEDLIWWWEAEEMTSLMVSVSVWNVREIYLLRMEDGYREDWRFAERHEGVKSVGNVGVSLNVVQFPGIALWSRRSLIHGDSRLLRGAISSMHSTSWVKLWRRDSWAHSRLGFYYVSVMARRMGRGTRGHLKRRTTMTNYGI